MKKNNNIVLHIAFLVYFAILLRMTVLRPGFLESEPLSGVVVWRIFEMYRQFIRNHAWGTFTYYLIGNILCFIPLGYYLKRVTPWPTWILVGLSAAVSVAIEIGQYVLGTGVSELDDVLLNTLGAGIGIVTAILINKTRKVE